MVILLSGSDSKIHVFREVLAFILLCNSVNKELTLKQSPKYGLIGITVTPKNVSENVKVVSLEGHYIFPFYLLFIGKWILWTFAHC